MNQKEFHKLYQLTPEGFKAELIGGVVYVMASPVSPRHGRAHTRVQYWLCMYADHTPGTEPFDNTTSALNGESEPQPDACLLVLSEYGGRATIIEDECVSGPLDLVVEVANTSRAIDLGAKKRDYERAGVQEYVVVLTKEKTVRWFRLAEGGYVELPIGSDGLYRSVVFPGLWLEPSAMFAPTSRRLTATLRRGLASPEHAAFVKELAARKKKLKPKSRKKK